MNLDNYSWRCVMKFKRYWPHTLFFLFISVPVVAIEICVPWDVPCHERNLKRLEQTKDQVVDKVNKVKDQVVDKVRDVVDNLVDLPDHLRQFIVDTIGTFSTAAQGDLIHRLQRSLDALLSLKRRLLDPSDKGDPAITLVLNRVAEIERGVRSIMATLDEMQHLPTSVVPADLGVKIVSLGEELNKIAKIKQLTDLLNDLVISVKPIFIDLFEILILFAQNSRRSDMETIYRRRLDDVRRFMDLTSSVLQKIGTEWDKLAGEITSTVIGAGNLLQATSGLLEFMLSFTNFTTQDLLNMAFSGMETSSAGIARSNMISTRSLVSDIGASTNQVWNLLNALGKHVGLFVDYGLDEILPLANKTLLIMDHRLSVMQTQKAGFGKLYTMCEIIASAVPFLLTLGADTGALDRLLIALTEVSQAIFELLNGPLGQVGRSLKIIPDVVHEFTAEDMSSLVTALQKLRKDSSQVLSLLNTEIPKVLDVLKVLSGIQSVIVPETATV